MSQFPTVILIDDDASDRALYRRYLEKKSSQTYHIVEFELGKAAIEFCQQAIPDVIVLDYLLPDYDGLEILAKLRQLGQPYLPVIMLTGQGSETVAVQAMKLGAQDYLVKGELTVEQFRHTVTAVLKQRTWQLHLKQSQKQQQHAELQAKAAAHTAKLQQLATLQQAILDGAHYSIISTDPNGIILTFNQGAERMLGYTATEVIGHSTPEFLHDPDEILEAARELTQALGTPIVPGFEVFIAKSNRGQIEEREWTYIRKDGSRFPVLLSMSVLRDQQGNITGYLSIGNNITRQKQAEAVLRQQNDGLEQARREAEAANRAKSEFLAMMSHEIRTPMNAVIGMTSLLLDTDLSAIQQDFVETIRNSGDALVTIINDILDFSKIDSGKLDLEQCPFSLYACLAEVMELLTPQATEKGLNLSYSITPTIPATVIGDVTRLRQILVNLLGNAIKFTEVGNILVEVTADKVYNAAPGVTQPEIQYETQFTVRDTGIGIPPDRMERLFKPFSQVDASVTRHYGGTGLGLAISQRLCQMMGGEMWVESQMGFGSTFYFTIQLAAPPTHSSPVKLAHSLQPKTDGQAMANQSPLRILLAEDHVVNQKVALLMLQHLGYQADLVANGLEVLEALRQHSYDVVLLDVQMPEMDGLTAARHICQEWTAENRPRLIAMTANAMQGDRQLCLDAGIDDYLSKPVRIEALMQALKRCQGKRESNVSGAEVVNSKPAITPAPIPTAMISHYIKDGCRKYTGAIALEELQAFRQSMGNDSSIFVALLTCYLEETPRLLQNLNKAIAQGDQETVNRTAHSLKASSATLGAVQLAALCRELEHYSKHYSQYFDQYHPGLKPEQSERQQNQFEHLLRLIDQIEAEYQQVKAALKQVIQNER